VFSFIDGFENLSSQVKTQFVEVLIDAVTAGISQVKKTPISIDEGANLSIIAFFLASLILKVESQPSSTQAAVATVGGKKGKASKIKSDSSFDWNDWNATAVETLIAYFDVDQGKLWKMSIVQESFLSVMYSSAYQLIEHHPGNSLAQDKVIKSTSIRLISTCMSHFQSASQSGSLSSLSTTLFSGLLQYEHIAPITAQLCIGTTTPAKGLMAELLNDITSQKVITSGLKNVGLFIETYANMYAQGLVSCLPLLVTSLDHPAHQIRSSLLAAFGKVCILDIFYDSISTNCML
jgi:hypothetical protein